MDVDVEMKQLELDFGIKEKVYVEKDENDKFSEITKNKEKLPDDIYYNKENNTYFRLVDNLSSQEEITKLMLYKQTAYLKTIKNGVMFFVVLQCIGVGAFILMFTKLFQ